MTNFISQGDKRLFPPQLRKQMPTRNQILVKGCCGGKNGMSAVCCPAYQADIITRGPTFRRAVTCTLGELVDEVVKNMNVRYSRDNKNNKNLLRDSSY